jgi:DNA-binding NarL/FixJ family response regulator
MTPEKLRQVEDRYERAFLNAESARRARNRVVLEALDAGWTHAQIAEATGLSRARVGQLAPKR